MFNKLRGITWLILFDSNIESYWVIKYIINMRSELVFSVEKERNKNDLKTEIE